jgi:hypothetical protein
MIGAEARAEDQDKLLLLHQEQDEIISFLKDKEGSIKQKIIRLAEILEERMQRADPELPPSLTTNLISSQITSIFRENGIRSVNYVRECLTEKYKDQSQQRIVLVNGEGILANDIEILKEIGGDIHLLKEKISNVTSHQDLEVLHEIFDEAKKATAARATALGVILSGFEKKDSHKTPTPPPEITDCAEAILYFIEKLQNTYKFFIKFPPTADKNPLWAAGIVQLAKLFPSLYNEKFSLLKIMWWSRIKYMTHQSKHGAAVKDEIMTMLCENCYDIKTGTERPDTNAEMIRDFKSPTGWRCGSCNGIQGHMRGLTREQVGDNKQPYITQAEEFVFSFPFFVEMVEYYISSYMPYGYGRKVDLGVELSKQA